MTNKYFDQVDLHRELENLLGTSAGDEYEGWSEYWDDQVIFEEKITNVLLEWRNFCEEKVSKK